MPWARSATPGSGMGKTSLAKGTGRRTALATAVMEQARFTGILAGSAAAPDATTRGPGIREVSRLVSGLRRL